MTDQTAPQSGNQPDFLRADLTSNTRALTLYALGVIIGLVLGGIGLFQARGTTTNKVPDEDLALVNRRPILRSDFVTQLENETGIPFAQSTRQDQLRVLDEMLREEMFVQRGLELDFAETDQDTRSALYNIVEQQVTASAALGKASEKELHDYFDQYRAEFQSEGKLDMHHWVMATEDSNKAAAAVKALRDGGKPADVAKRFKLVEDNYYGPEFYYLSKAHHGEKLFPLAQALDAGQVADAAMAEDGYHILQVVSNDRPHQQSFEEARSALPAVYSNHEKTRVMTNMMNFLRSRSTILIADDYKNDYKPEDFAGGN